MCERADCAGFVAIPPLHIYRNGKHTPHTVKLELIFPSGTTLLKRPAKLAGRDAAAAESAARRPAPCTGGHSLWPPEPIQLLPRVV